MLQPLIETERRLGTVKNGDFVSVYGEGSWINKPGNQPPKFRKKTVRETWAFAMGNDWMKTSKELAESIPWPYTHYIGIELFKNLKP